MSATGATPSLSTADDDAKLKAISTSGACAQGRALTLDFSAIQHRLGSRWPSRREDIWAKLDQVIERQAGPSTLWLRIHESEYLLCFAPQYGYAAQAIAFRIMEEGLLHFLGRFDPSDLLVNRVTLIANGAISRLPLQPGDGSPSPRASEEVRSFAPEPKALSTPLLVADTTEDLILRCGVEDVVNLKTEATVGLRITGHYYSQRSHRTLTIPERAAMPTRALATMDRWIAQAIAAMFRERDPKLLIAPLSLHTFGTSKARLAVIEELNRLDQKQRSRLIIELGGFETGTPTSRLAETASMLKPFCHSVGAQSMPCRSSILAVSNARLQSLSVSARDLGGDGPRLAAGLLACGQAANGMAPRLVATDLPSEGFLSVCSVAGFTLATIGRETGRAAEGTALKKGRREAPYLAAPMEATTSV